MRKRKDLLTIGTTKNAMTRVTSLNNDVQKQIQKTYPKMDLSRSICDSLSTRDIYLVPTCQFHRKLGVAHVTEGSQGPLPYMYVWVYSEGYDSKHFSFIRTKFITHVRMLGFK